MIVKRPDVMGKRIGAGRVFLFFQGPHGPFFTQVAAQLRKTGAETLRMGFNMGDRLFWNGPGYIPFKGDSGSWADAFKLLAGEKSVTDIVLYGDTRPVHADAIKVARELGIMIHVFEEGYLRPHWVTYERDGSNGYSRLMDMKLTDMQAALAKIDLELPAPPAKWGDLRQHVFYGATYHAAVLFANFGYRNFQPHRSLTVAQEFRLYIQRLLLMPLQAVERFIATQRVKFGGFPYHLVLLQLAHDASFRKHGPFNSMTEFLEAVIAGFAEGAEVHHHLVFKAHPLEDGRAGIRATLRRLAREHDITDRVHYVRGGKLAELLDHTRSVTTVNSTAAQQALWRGLPIKAFGQAVYSKPEFVSDQALPAFYAHPTRPDTKAYRDYRHYLMESSQITGGFYAARGRRRLLRQVVDMMLSPEDPYDALTMGTAPPRHHLRVVPQ